MKEQIMKILNGLYKIANMIFFYSMVAVSISMLVFGIRWTWMVTLALGVIYLVLIKIENLEERLRILEGRR